VQSLEEERVETALLADDVVFWPRLKDTSTWKPRYQAMQAALDRCSSWARDWKMQWSTNKSNVVFFARSGSRVTPYSQLQTLLLSGSALQPAQSYTYLGLVLHQRGSWKQHFDRVHHRALTSSYLITRVNQRHAPPSPSVIRQLVMSMPRATILWALPFWRPTQAQYASLDCCLVTPLRTALALPPFTSRAALLTEFGLADWETTRQQQLLAYASRLAHSTVEDHPARQLYRRQLYTSPDIARSHAPDSFWGELRALQRGWQCRVSKLDTQELKQLMIRRYFDQYQQSMPSTVPPRPGLRAIKLQPGVSRYLYHDSKSMAVLRAKLRFDIHGLQMGVVGTRVAAASASPAAAAQDTRCQLCAASSSDSRVHLVTRCPLLEPVRSDMNFLLQEDWSNRTANSSRLRVASYRCNHNESLLRFVLGELNCITAVLSASSGHMIRHRHVHRNGAKRNWGVKEKVFSSDCGCAYPGLSVESRLQASAVFVQHLFRRRFPGTALGPDAVASSA
jgi:hypothetical protein